MYTYMYVQYMHNYSVHVHKCIINYTLSGFHIGFFCWGEGELFCSKISGGGGGGGGRERQLGVGGNPLY